MNKRISPSSFKVVVQNLSWRKLVDLNALARNPTKKTNSWCLHIVVVGNKWFGFIVCVVFLRELNIRLRAHFIPLIFNAEKCPLESTEHFQNSDCKHSKIIMPKMGRQLVSPGTSQDQIASYHPNIYLQNTYLNDYCIIGANFYRLN